MTMLPGGFTSLANTPDLNVTSVIMEKFTAGMESAPYKQYFRLGTTEREEVKVAAFSGFGAMPQYTDGAAIALDAASQRYAFRAAVVDYALGFKVSHRMSRSDLLELLPRFSNGLGKAAAETLRTVHGNILNRAFNSSYAYGDAKELCATDHPTAGSTGSNELTTPADLSNASLNDALTAMSTTVDHRGKLAGITGKLLIVPPALRKTAHQIVGSVGEAYTTDRQDNFFRGMGLQYVVDESLTDTDAWFVVDPDNSPLFSLVREGFVVQGYRDEPSRSDVVYGSMAFVASAEDWRGIFGTPGA